MPRQRAVHLVMRASSATGTRSFLTERNKKGVRQIVYKTAELRGVKLHRFANSGNHLHLIIQAPSRPAYVSYIRAISGLIARLVTKQERGKSSLDKISSRPKAGRFWDARPFTRIITWGRDFRRVCGYLLQNQLEALGFIPYRPRGRAKKKNAKTKPPSAKL